MLKKNDRIITQITDYTDDGLGVGRIAADDGTFTLFIKDTAVGDKVEAVVTGLKKSFGYGRVLSVLEPSPDRVDPACPVASSCGGCNMRHISYEAQLAWKKRRVADCMKRIGGFEQNKDFKLFNILGMKNPERYRNKAQYPVGIKDGRVVTGFFAGRTHTVVPSEDCMIEPEVFGELLGIIRAFIEANNISVYDENTGKGIVRHVLLREGMDCTEIMVCIVVNAMPSDKCASCFYGLAQELKKHTEIKTFLLSHNTKKTNVILGDKESVLFGDGRIRDCIGEKIYEISARSFYQVNPSQTKVLYDIAAEYAGLTGSEVVWDLYCGTGTIGIYLADRARAVYGVEIVEKAVEDARRNAQLNGISNVYFECGKSEDICISDYEDGYVTPDGIPRARALHSGRSDRLGEQEGKGLALPLPDVIVVDPPRKGCDERLLDTISGSGALRLVYVSCNPATFARDAALLKERGYILKSLQPVDMFPHTTGVECVGLFLK